MTVISRFHIAVLINTLQKEFKLNRFNIPNDQRDAVIHLKARKWAIIDLEAALEEHGIPVSCAVLGQMSNDIEEINKLLEV